MFAEPTINDFRENVRWHLAEAMTRAQGSIAAIKADHASRGILQSGMTYQRIFATVRDEFDAGTRTALGELKRAVRATKLDRDDLRQTTTQCLTDFENQAKALVRANLIRGVPSILVDQNLQSLDQHLTFVTRQFDVGFLDPREPEMPQVHNAINIGAMTGSTIQQGSPDARQTVQFSLVVESAQSALDAFEKAIQGVSVPSAAMVEIVADVQTIKAQLSKPSPSLPIVQEAGKSLRAIVEGVAAGILTSPVIAAAPALWSALGLS
jgi:hypothetical protein